MNINGKSYAVVHNFSDFDPCQGCAFYASIKCPVVEDTPFLLCVDLEKDQSVSFWEIKK